MEHKDIMIFHKIKYKHIGWLFLLFGAISSYWTVNTKGNLNPLGFLSIVCCIILIIISILTVIHKWDDTIL